MKIPWTQPVAGKPHLYRLSGSWFVVPGNAAGHPWHRRRLIRARNRAAYHAAFLARPWDECYPL